MSSLQKRRVTTMPLMLMTLAMILAACGGTATDPTDDTATAETEDESQGEPEGEATDGASETAATEGGEEFQALVAAAQEEGKLLLNTLVGDGFVEMAEQFGETYGIDVEVNQGRVSDMATQVLSEREAGRYTVDAWYQTYIPMLSRLMPAGAMEPVAPALVHEDVLDESNWKGNAIRYMDDEQEYLPVIGRLPALLYSVNTENVPEDQRPTTFEELINFEGEMATALPGQSGDEFHLWLLEIGREDVLERLAERKPTQIADLNQAFVDLARGRFDLLIGGTKVRVEPVLAQGLPVQPVSFLENEEEFAGLETVNAVTPAISADAPHPNAAKLFVNWIMTYEGALAASKAGGTESFRVDVPTDHLDEYQIMDADAEAAGRYTFQSREMVDRQDADRARLTSIFDY